MKIKTFEDIIAWQKAKTLTLTIYQRTTNLKDYSFKDQICRASISIMNNIAEGFERQTDKEFIYYLHIAKGSSAEVRSMLHIARDLHYIDMSVYENLLQLSIETSKTISGLIKSLTKK